MALMAGISGVRGIVGDTLTPALVRQFAEAFGRTRGGGHVLLGRDTRPSGEMFAAQAETGLLAAGCRVTRLGVAMTPTVAHAVLHGSTDGAIIITASHNPAQWNGLKFLDEFGLAPDPLLAARIADQRSQLRDDASEPAQPTESSPIAIDDDAGRRHVEAVLNVVSTGPTPQPGLRVVLDSVNGAGCLHSPDLLSALGCEVIHLNGEPTGEFAHAPEPLAENLSQLCAAVRETRAAIGFAQDPDADRLAIVDENGRYVGEEYTLVLAVESVLSRRRGSVVTNLSTSRMIDDVTARHNVTVFRTPVGEAHVARAIREHKSVFGGEGNGGVIDPRISFVRDSLSAMSLVLQLMADQDATVSELVDALPRYALIKRKFECPPEKVPAALDAVAAAFAGQRVDRSDGVRVDFPDSWVLLRPSNTEPIVRIMAEANDARTAEALVQRVRAAAGL